MNTLILSSCNNGNLDFLNPIAIGFDNFTQNVAIAFMKEMNNIKEVYAWDGVSTYIPVLGLEYATDVQKFRDWSSIKNGFERLATGQIIYYRNGNNIEFTPRVKYGIRVVQLHDGTYGEDYFIYNPLEVIK